MGFVGTNSEILPVLVYATAIAGVPFVPVNYRLTDDRLRSVVSRIAPALGGRRRRERSDRGNRGCRGDRSAAPRGPLGAVTAGRGERCTARRAGRLLFTSGTTGEPKAAVLRHRHLAVVRHLDRRVHARRRRTRRRWSACRPTTSPASPRCSPHLRRAPHRLPARRSARRSGWRSRPRERRSPTPWWCPTMLGRILECSRSAATALPHLRALSYGGGRMPPAVVERALRLLPERRLRQRLRPHRDQLDDRRADRRRPPRRPRLRRSGGAPPAGLGRPAAADDRAGDPRARGRGAAGRRVRRGLRARRADRRRVRGPEGARRTTAGSPPTTPAGWTRTATCSSRAGSTT